MSKHPKLLAKKLNMQPTTLSLNHARFYGSIMNARTMHYSLSKQQRLLFPREESIISMLRQCEAV